MKRIAKVTRLLLLRIVARVALRAEIIDRLRKVNPSRHSMVAPMAKSFQWQIFSWTPRTPRSKPEAVKNRILREQTL
ncbi:MAG: hypothetical protein DME75_12300 [Verrucomicrobia bacterium]|nr:MAG: hypothetical protein DME75_12300 [Verrucomicrobiota bacterium]